VSERLDQTAINALAMGRGAAKREAPVGPTTARIEALLNGVIAA
jgi:hypothetical protein